MKLRHSHHNSRQPNRDQSLVDQVFADRARLPVFLRPAHALITGLPSRSKRHKQTTPLRLFAMDTAWLAAFSTLAGTGGAIISAGSLWGLLPAFVGSLGAVGRLRRLVVGHVHEATHGVVTKFYRERGVSKPAARRISEFILDIGTALTFTLNGQDYRREHARHHRPPMLGTLRDPDGAALYQWGVWPSKSQNLYHSLAAIAFNPLWHLGFFYDRIKTNLLKGKAYRRALGATALAALIGSAFILPFSVWLFAIFIPWGPGYQIASLLQVATEHPYGFDGPAENLEQLAARTWERIPYQPMPSGTFVNEPAAWLRWAGEMTLKVSERLTILDDTMIAHGWHHLAWPVGRPFNDWWNTAGQYLDARDAGILPADSECRVVAGVSDALSRQKKHFAARRQQLRR